MSAVALGRNISLRLLRPPTTRTVACNGTALSLTGWTDASDMIDMVPREMTEMVTRDTTFLAKLKQGAWLVAELFLRVAVNPRLRARLLNFLGAEVGGNVRVYESRFFNLQNGFRNLRLADDVHIGTGSMLDLAGPLHLDRGAVVDPGTIVLTHSEPGAAHGSPLAERFPPSNEAVTIAPYVWIGAGAVILDGVEVGDEAVIAAGAVVTGRVPAHEVRGGVPARRIDGE